MDSLAATRNEAAMELPPPPLVSDSKDMWMIIWVHGKYSAMIMTMFRFMMMMMDAFSFGYVVGMLFLLDDVPRRSFS